MRRYRRVFLARFNARSPGVGSPDDHYWHYTGRDRLHYRGDSYAFESRLMNTLIIYDSAYGNTAKVAYVIENEASAFGNVKHVMAKDFKASDIAEVDVMFIGSPTQGGRPTQPISDLVNSLASDVYKRIPVATFDTRFATDDHGFGLKILMKTIGFASPKIAASIKHKSGRILGSPEGFIVDDKEGPLLEGELKRTAEWTKKILTKFKSDAAV